MRTYECNNIVGKVYADVYPKSARKASFKKKYNIHANVPPKILGREIRGVYGCSCEHSFKGEYESPMMYEYVVIKRRVYIRVYDLNIGEHTCHYHKVRLQLREDDQGKLKLHAKVYPQDLCDCDILHGCH
jgi:hypothetical protein